MASAHMLTSPKFTGSATVLETITFEHVPVPETAVPLNRPILWLYGIGHAWTVIAVGIGPLPRFIRVLVAETSHASPLGPPWSESWPESGASFCHSGSCKTINHGLCYRP